MNTKEGRKFEQLVYKISPQGRLLRSWDLKGGVSAQVTALEIGEPDGRITKLVVRRHGDADLRRNPNIAADEFRLLQTLHAAGLPVPEPYYFDQSGEIFSRPYIVVAFIDGETDFAPADVTAFVRELAHQLARIHSVDCQNPDLPPLPRQDEAVGRLLDKRPAKLDDSLSEGRTRETLESIWPLPSPNAPAMLHGDFWPGNLLWKEGKLAGIIDWEDAAVGDPLADLANGRLEILWAFGFDAMREFTHQYRRLIPDVDLTNLACWDLCAALRPASKLAGWGLDAETERTMRARHNEFVNQAYETLSVRLKTGEV